VALGLDPKDEIKVDDIDIRNYVKYIFEERTDVEKRELVGCFKSKLKIANKSESF